MMPNVLEGYCTAQVLDQADYLRTVSMRRWTWWEGHRYREGAGDEVEPWIELREGNLLETL